jgi:prevent-host-death family protein
MAKVGSEEFQREYGKVTDLAMEEPVTITRNGRDRLVVMSAREYERMKMLLGETTALATEEVSKADMLAATDQTPPPGNDFSGEDYIS